jgi:hypothetical protein
VAEWVGRIADDSTRGRDTPSPELDRLAAAIGIELGRASLTPAGDSGGFLQRYPLTTRQLQPARSSVSWTQGGRSIATLPFGEELGFAQGTVPAAPLSGPVVILGGAIDPTRVPAAFIRDKVVVWAADFASPAAEKADAIAATLVAGAPRAVIIVPGDRDLARGMVSGQSSPRLVSPVPGLTFTALATSAEALARGNPALAALVEKTRGRTDTALEQTDFEATITATDSVLDRPTVTAPNVVALRRGDDPKVADQVIVVSAHLDHLGVVAGPDSIMNGADDNASGAAGALLLARALATPGLRLRRSVAVLLVSGEEKGLWGSANFVARSPWPLDRIVAEINLDMIGRGWRDTVGVIGREFSGLGTVLDSVAQLHPELRVTPIGDAWPEQKRFFRSDHYSFARRGVPSLFLSSGYSPDYHAPGDSAEKIDAEKEARLLRLVFHFIVALANR